MRESEENVCRLKENSQSGPTRGPEMLDLSSTTAPHAVDISGAEFLSEAVRIFCFCYYILLLFPQFSLRASTMRLILSDFVHISEWGRKVNFFFFNFLLLVFGCILLNLNLQLWQLKMQEKKLCDEMRILPTHYLNMQQTISMEIFKGNITKKSDAHRLFNVDPNKVDKVYEMLVKKGVAQA